MSELGGILPSDKEKFLLCGITTREDLLRQGSLPSGRALLKDKLGVCPWRLLRWVHRADIARVEGIDCQCAALLEYIGLDTVPELAEREATEIYPKMCLANARKNFKPDLPTQAQVASWIGKARGMERKIYY